MPYDESPYAKIAAAISPAIRKIGNLQSRLSGTTVSLLRITMLDDDFTGQNFNVFGDQEPEWASTVLSNVRIKYPFSRMEMFTSLTGSGSQQSIVESADMLEFLPIELDMFFSEEDGDPDTDPYEMVEGDMLVDVLFDAKMSVLPIVLQIKRVFGTFYEKHLIRKTAEIVLMRGKLDSQLQNEIDKFVTLMTPP